MRDLVAAADDWRPSLPRLSAARYALALGLPCLVALLSGAAWAEPFDRGLLWRLDRSGIAPSYVFGTLHSADPRVTTLAPPVAQAFADCRTFAMEISLSGAEQTRFLEATQFDDGRRLESLLGAQTYARLRRALGERAPPEEVLARTKPWAALLRIAAPRFGDEGPTLDRELFTAARMRHMSIVGLELLDEQIVALDGIPLDTQLALLRYAIDHYALLESQLAPTIQAWLDRDLAALSRINLGSVAGDPTLRRHQAILTHHLVDDRTAVMAHRLFLPLRAGGVFVAVGALHLYGANGILAQLRRQGYSMRRVY